MSPVAAAKPAPKAKGGRKVLGAATKAANAGKAKAAKPAAAASASSKAAPKGNKKGGKTIEQIYQKKSQLEHILLRPDTYGEP